MITDVLIGWLFYLFYFVLLLLVCLLWFDYYCGVMLMLWRLFVYVVGCVV